MTASHLSFENRETATDEKRYFSVNPVADRSVRFAERETLSAIAAEAEKAWVREGVEGTQIGRRGVVDEGGRSGNDGGAHLKDIELRAERCGIAIQEIGLDARPFACFQSLQQGFDRSDGFRGRDSTVPGAIHESLAQQAAVIVHTVHNVLVSGFILHDDEAVALGVHGEDGNIDLAIENNILLEIVDRLRTRLDAGGAIQRVEVFFQAEAGGLIERPDFVAVNRFFELLAIVHAGVPGDVAAGARFEFGAKSEYERKINLLIPEKLICFLTGEIGGRWFRRSGSEPAGSVAESCSEGDACAALWRGLGGGENVFGQGEICGGIRDANHLQIGGGREERLESEFGVERGVPGGYAARQHSAHGLRCAEALGISLDQSGGDNAAQRMSPGDGGDGVGKHGVKQIKHGDLIGESFVNGPAGGRVGGAGERETIGEEKSAGSGIADIGGGVGAARRDITMAIEKQGAVPIVRNLDQVGGSVAERAGFCGEVGLRARGIGDGKNENRSDGDEKHGGFNLLPHFNSSYCCEVPWSVAPAKLSVEGISQTAPDVAGTAGVFVPRNQKFNLQPS